MTRRDALTRIAYLMGGTLIATEPFLSGTRLSGKPLASAGFTKDDLALMDEIGETIIPTTDTPGAKATAIGAFMAMMVADCYDDAHQTLFQVGLKKIDETCRQRFEKTFRQATPAQRTELLNALDVEQKDLQRKKAKDELPHYFRLIKELTLVGYFTSEIGASQTLQYSEVPGRLDGNVPYKKPDRASFNPPSRSLQ